jgi:hypothetical protein
MKNNTKKGISTGEKIAIGGTVAALSAATVGAYYLLGPNAKEHQKKVKVLMSKMKKEVASQAKKAKVIALPMYHQTVDAIADNYSKQYKIYEGDIQVLAQKLKEGWKKSQQTVKKVAKTASKKSAKITKKITKK